MVNGREKSYKKHNNKLGNYLEEEKLKEKDRGWGIDGRRGTIRE